MPGTVREPDRVPHAGTVVQEWPTGYVGTCNGNENPGVYWAWAHLVRVATVPPRYELVLATGLVMRLRSEQWEPRAFRVAYIEAVGAFPAFDAPLGKAVTALFERLLDCRDDVDMPSEAGARGMLLEDIKLAIISCPQADDASETDNGALYNGPEGTWINARLLMSRVATGCPVKFTPGDYFEALYALGLRQAGKPSLGGWRGRVWAVPEGMLPVVQASASVTGAAVGAPALPPGPAAAAATAAQPAPGTTPGQQLEWDPDAEDHAFSDMLK